MSRGIRDLRDLICVSRLTVRHSDDEIFSSDDGVVDKLSARLSSASASGTEPSRECSAVSIRDINSPDSGIATNGNSPQDSTDNNLNNLNKSNIAPHPPNIVRQKEDVPRAFRKKKRKKKILSEIPPVRHELPKTTPLPPVTHWTHSRPSSSSGESSKNDVQSPPVPNHINAPVDGNFDKILTYLDATLVSEWLQTSNGNVTDMATWCHAGENFVQFSHFWLSQFPDIQKHEFFKLEHGIIVDNLNFAFAAGMNDGVINRNDLVRFVKAIFREYPEKLLSLKGQYLFLDYLDILSSERQDAYRKLLSDVKCSTRIKQHAQWVLAVRSFALVSLWMSVLNFYRRLVANSEDLKKTSEPVSLASVNKKDPYQVRMYHAIRNGFIEVVQYLIKSKKVDPRTKDLNNKNLLFTAVMLNQPKVLKFLLNNIQPCADVNEPADTGNTALHAAANSGNCEIVDILINAKGVNVDVTNAQCDDATPLHCAVMHGHTKVVEQLLKAGAKTDKKMGDLTVLTIATDFGHDEIVEIIKSYSISVS